MTPGGRCWFRLYQDEWERRGRVLRDQGVFGLVVDEDETGVAHTIPHDHATAMDAAQVARLETYGDVPFTRDVATTEGGSSR